MDKFGRQSAVLVQIRDRVVPILLSWPFLLSLAVLIVNDVYLKYEFSNWMTGKLSDIAGIYLVALLAIGMWPSKKYAVGATLAVAFLFWKSPASQLIIDSFNSVSRAQIGRVVDYSDLLALVVIPLAWTTTPSGRSRPSKRVIQRLLSFPIATVTLFAVMGTSVLLPEGEYIIRNTDNNVQVDQSGFVAAIERVTDEYKLECEAWEGTTGTSFCSSDDMNFWYTLDEAADEVRFQIHVTKMEGVFLPDPDYDYFDKFLHDLKAELGQLSPSMEFVQDISRPPNNTD